MKKNSLLSLALFGLTSWAVAQNEQEKSKILRETNVAELQQFSRQWKEKQLAEKKKALELAHRNGWQVFISMPNGTFAELQRVDERGKPVYYVTQGNLAAAQTTRADRLWTGGSMGLNLNGQGMIVGEWDGGPVRSTHQEFGTRVTQKDGVTFASGSASSMGYRHATHVAGTLIASGVTANAKGMAHQATLWANEWNNDKSEMASQASQGLILSNHSYGYRSDLLSQWQFGFYDAEAADWDQIAVNAPFYTIVKAAGNDRGAGYNPGGVFGTTGYNLITGSATSKNVLVVAAVSAVTNYTGPSSVTMSSFSSWGPTDDGRIKPDISGCGVNLNSSTSTSNTAYEIMSGTSMASPNVTGSLVLIQQHYKNLNAGQFMRSATLRGLVIHTADEAGANPGPDYAYGWGLLNAQKAVQTITNRGTSAIIDERTLNNATTYTLNVVASGSGPLEVTIAWNDPKGTPLASGTLNSTSPRLVNDLDVRVTQGSSTFFPWRLDPASPASAATKGDNIRDNVEKITIDAPVAGATYTITVSHKGTLSGSAQPYSLIVTGINVGGGTPPPSCAVPSSLTTSAITASSATLNWGAVSGASNYDVRVKPTSSSTWTNYTAVTGTSLNVTGLTASTTYEWQIRANCSGSSSAYSGSVNFTTSAASVSWCASNGSNNSYEWIDLVRLGSINRTSGRETGGYVNTGLSTNLVRGTTYTINFSAGFSSTAYTEYWKIWIDWNRDGDFLDAGEQIVNGTSSSSATLSASFTVPTTAVLGNTRMRVSMSDASQNSCGSFSYGEVEDYTINVVSSSARMLTTASEFDETNFEANVYPNPVIKGNLVKIELPNEVGSVNVQIFDMSGRVVKQSIFEGTNYEINTSEFSKGIYIIQMASEKGKTTKKLVVD
ncbi:S8 family serine peptidase [Raineya orbicola]|jgi:hypothetical protein|uniref:Por secretion system C-terminal sorting domain n=1 Tax=Raineya orbicola TaxID=2016530 RepID=A0A2N3IHC7_9BACT|nr:S8 family serine peptidase [Raineya orbicola]PKQ69729.1 Por secretion system C-terminal sorting domain [Raineya orbicola]